jgi:hypothetical protein
MYNETFIPYNMEFVDQMPNMNLNQFPNDGESNMEIAAPQEHKGGVPMRSSNLRSLTKPKENFRETIEKYLASYFKHLIDLKEKMKGEYLDESVFTLLIKRDDGKYYMEADNVRGKDNAFQGLSIIAAIKNYNFVHSIIQPGLGNGAMVTLYGTADAGYPFFMTLNIVRISKKYKILNQLIQIG